MGIGCYVVCIFFQSGLALLQCFHSCANARNELVEAILVTNLTMAAIGFLKFIMLRRKISNASIFESQYTSVYRTAGITRMRTVVHLVQCIIDIRQLIR